jgi:predicted lipoprotein with Yx(FWY)xxD motif
MTLYTYHTDQPGKSNCSDECEAYWPPAKATADSKARGSLTLVKRARRTMQWADDGNLHTLVQDKKPGDVIGDGKNRV